MAPPHRVQVPAPSCASTGVTSPVLGGVVSVLLVGNPGRVLDRQQAHQSRVRGRDRDEVSSWSIM
jgi:hypothetical protein